MRIYLRITPEGWDVRVSEFYGFS